MSKPQWALSAAAFEGLLAALGPDRERAAVEYERIRTRLVKFFEWRGCTRADEYTDRTLDRVARRIAEGAEVRTRDPYGFIHGVALNLLQEYWREPATRWSPITDAEPEGTAAPRQAEAADTSAREASLECLEGCLGALRPDARSLLARYHAPGGDQIRARRALAAEIGIPLNALRIRAFRLRSALERCVNECRARQGRS